MSSNRLQNRKRRANIVIEALLLLPIVMILVAALVEFAMMITVNQRLAAASANGCRVASQGGGREDVEAAVRRSLGKGALNNARIEVVANKSKEHKKQPLRSGDTVEVIVHIQAGEVVPDLLAFIGLSLKDETLVGRTAQRVE